MWCAQDDNGKPQDAHKSLEGPKRGPEWVHFKTSKWCTYPGWVQNGSISRPPFWRSPSGWDHLMRPREHQDPNVYLDAPLDVKEDISRCTRVGSPAPDPLKRGPKGVQKGSNPRIRGVEIRDPDPRHAVCNI